ncbi:MAG: 4Fe-4S dicluster domain-containing protein, partial [Candidatus Bathyarchaeia archaeon]
CVDACPYDAVKLNGSRPLICDLCGGEPACVERCPTEALAFVDCEGEAECPEEIFQAMLRRWGIVG